MFGVQERVVLAALLVQVASLVIARWSQLFLQRQGQRSAAQMLRRLEGATLVVVRADGSIEIRLDPDSRGRSISDATDA